MPNDSSDRSVAAMEMAETECVDGAIGTKMGAPHNLAVSIMADIEGAADHRLKAAKWR